MIKIEPYILNWIFRNGKGTKVKLPDGIHFMESTVENMDWLADVDTRSITTMNGMFMDCYNLKTIPIFNTSNVTDMSLAFVQCKGITSVAQLDTGKATSMKRMFYYCIKLESVPIFNTSKVTNMDQMFTKCSALSDESLNNIMRMCINSRVSKSNKTLYYLGLTSAQATTCQTLSNWNDFVTAGWSTGY